MTIKIKKTHKNATFKKAHESDIGYDLTACDYEYKGNGLWFIKLGINAIPPKGIYFEVVPRSSFCKTPFILSNDIGIIDPEYRGEWVFPVRHLERPFFKDDVENHCLNSLIYSAEVLQNALEIDIEEYLIRKRITQIIPPEILQSALEIDIVQYLIGKRIAQAIPRLVTYAGEIKYVDKLSQTKRGDGGFGSTGE